MFVIEMIPCDTTMQYSTRGMLSLALRLACQKPRDGGLPQKTHVFSVRRSFAISANHFTLWSDLRKKARK